MSEAGKYEPTKERCIVIIENNIRGICEKIYDLTLAGSFAVKMGNSASAEKSEKALVDLQKTRQLYEEELKTVKAEKK